MDGHKAGKPLDKWLPRVLHYNRNECVISSDATQIAYLASPIAHRRRSSKSLLKEDPWDFTNIRKHKESCKPLDCSREDVDWLGSILYAPPNGTQKQPLDPFAYLHFHSDDSSSESKTANDTPSDFFTSEWPLDAHSQYGYDANDDEEDAVEDENAKLSSRISTSHVTAPQDPHDEFGDSSDNFKPLFSDTPLDSLIPDFKHAENDVDGHKSVRDTIPLLSKAQKPSWKPTGLFSPIRNLRRRNKDVLDPEDIQTPLSMLKVLLENIQVEFKDPSKEIEKMLEAVPTKPANSTPSLPKTYDYKPTDTARVDPKASHLEPALPKTPLGPQRHSTQDVLPSRDISKSRRSPISIPKKPVDTSEFDDIIFDAFMTVDEHLPIKRLMHRQILPTTPSYYYNFDTETIEATQSLIKQDTIESEPVEYLKIEKLPTRSLKTSEFTEGMDGVDYLRSNVPSFEFGKAMTLHSAEELLADLECPINKLEGSRSHSHVLDDVVADGNDLIPGNYELQSLLSNSRFALYDDIVFSSQMTSFCLDANQHEAGAEGLSSDEDKSPASSVDDSDAIVEDDDVLMIEEDVPGLNRAFTLVVPVPSGEVGVEAGVAVEEASRLPPEPPTTGKVEPEALTTPGKEEEACEEALETTKDEIATTSAEEGLEESPGDYWSRLASQKSMVYRKKSTDYSWLYESCESMANELLEVRDYGIQVVDDASATIEDSKAIEPPVEDLHTLPSLIIGTGEDIEPVEAVSDVLVDDEHMLEDDKGPVQVDNEMPGQTIESPESDKDAQEFAEVESIDKLPSVPTVVEEIVQEEEVQILESAELESTAARVEFDVSSAKEGEGEVQEEQQLKQDEDLQWQLSQSSLQDPSYQQGDLIKSFKFDSQTWGLVDEDRSIEDGQQPLTLRQEAKVQVEDEIVCPTPVEPVQEDIEPPEEAKLDKVPSKPIEETKATAEEPQVLPEATTPKETASPPKAVQEPKAKEEKKKKRKRKKKRKHRKKSKEADDEIDSIQLRPLKNLVDKQLKEGFQATVYIITSSTARKNATSSLCKVRFDYERDILILETGANTFDIQASKIVAEEIPTVPGAPILLKLSMKGKKSSAVVIQSSNARNLEVLGGTVGWANVSVKSVNKKHSGHPKRSHSSSSRSSTSSESSDDVKSPKNAKQGVETNGGAPSQKSPLVAKENAQGPPSPKEKPAQTSKRGLLSRVLLRRKLSNANDYK